MEHQESEELTLPTNQFDPTFLINSMHTISLPEGYDNTGIDIPARGLCDGFQIQDNIDSFSMLTSEHLHPTGSSSEMIVPLELGSDHENTMQKQENDNAHIIHGGLQPIILGNINTANLMALLQRSSVTARPNEVSSTNERKHNNSPKMSSLLLQPELACRQAHPEPFTPMLYMTESDSFKSTYTENNILPLAENSDMDLNAKKRYLVADKHDLNERPKLTTSDTLILNHVTPPSEETMGSNTISSLLQTTITKTALAKDSSLFPLEKHPFSLMSNISDRVVPLESISPVSIFNHLDSFNDGKGTCSNFDTVSATENTSIPLLQNILISSGGIAKPYLTVIGSQRVPSSLLLMLKQTKAPVFQSSLNTAPLFQLQLGYNLQGKPEEANKLPEANTDFSNSASEFIDYDDNVLHKPNTLSRSDTLILGENSPSHMDGQEDIGISEEESESMYNQSEDKVVSVCPGSAHEFQVSQSEENSSSIQTHCSNIIDNISQKAQTSTLPFTAIFDNVVDTFENDTAFSFTDTQCSTQSLSSMLTCISKDHHNLSVLLDGQTNFVSPLSLSKDLPEHMPKEAKTNIMLGTNNISFEPSKLFVNSVTVSTTHLDQCSSISSKNANSVIIEGNSFTPCAMSVGSTNCAEATTTASDMTNLPATVIISGRYSSGPQHSIFNIADSTQTSNVSSNEISIPTVMLTDNQPNENMGSLLEPGPLNVTEHNSSQDEALLSDSLCDEVVEILCPFPCIKCEKMFRSKKELLQHEKSHQTVLKCDLCNASFTRMGNYTRHRKIHNLQSDTLNLYKCEHCGRDFLQRCDLKRHLLIHTKKEPYRCEKCGKGYIRRSDLVVHMRFHNKERAFKCTECDKRFFQSGDLNRHIRRTHHPDAQLTCGHCDRKYACETTLIRHMKASHKDIIVETVHQKLQESQNESGAIRNNTVFSTDDPD